MSKNLYISIGNIHTSFLKWISRRASLFFLLSRRALPFFVLSGVFAGALSGCGGSGEAGDSGLPDSFARLDLDQSNPRRFVQYYFGGYVAPTAADPFEAGLVHERGGHFYLDRDAFARHRPALSGRLRDANRNGRIEWEEMEAFIERSYNEARAIPPTFAAFADSAGFTPDSTWMEVAVHGAMTTAERRIYVREEAVRAGLRHAADADGRIVYPLGTVFVGRHYLNDALAETTVMRKRPDGFWDFFAYDREGLLARETSTPPRALRSPVQCVGCHFGNKAFEPEKSFPAPAPPGPHGPRGVYVPDAFRDAEVTRRLDEHRRRADTVLGLYGSLFASKLRTQRQAGTLPAEDAALLDALDL